MAKEIATLGGGCFWCLEAVYQEMKGVLSVESGYTGGHVKSPTYEEVCQGTTGHAEVVRITFDNEVVTYRQIVQIFFAIHNPTTLNRQGNDVGTQYRSAIYTHSPEQEETARQVMKEVEKIWDAPIVTEVTPAGTFYPAEDYHQNFFADNPYQPYCAMVVAPKVAHFRHYFRQMLKNTG